MAENKKITMDDGIRVMIRTNDNQAYEGYHIEDGNQKEIKVRMDDGTVVRAQMNEIQAIWFIYEWLTPSDYMSFF